MKAYVAHDRNYDCPYSMIIYAETPGKARAIAAESEEFEDFTFTDILVKRCADLDKFYHGAEILDWCNPYDRLLMVKYANFSCSYEMDLAECDCGACSAKDLCDRYQEQRRYEEVAE